MLGGLGLSLPGLLCLLEAHVNVGLKPGLNLVVGEIVGVLKDGDLDFFGVGLLLSETDVAGITEGDF